MLLVKVIENNLQKEIIINQKHISSFEPVDIDGIQTTCTRIRMSNGDSIDVISPPFEQWQVDAFITDQDY